MDVQKVKYVKKLSNDHWSYVKSWLFTRFDEFNKALMSLSNYFFIYYWGKSWQPAAKRWIVETSFEDFRELMGSY